MKTIGVKELKEHLSEVLREIEETGQIIGVSNRGRIVARLVPAQLGQRTKRVHASQLLRLMHSRQKSVLV